jgi:hypothetical protein
MTKEQRQSYNDKGYYENGCYEIAKGGCLTSYIRVVSEAVTLLKKWRYWT